MSTLATLLPLLILFFAATLSLFLSGKTSQRWAVAAVGTALLSLFYCLSLLTPGDEQVLPYLWTPLGAWSPQFGIVMIFDRMSFLFLFCTQLVAFFTLFIAPRLLPQHLPSQHFYTLSLFLLTGVTGAFLTGDLFNLYVWFEVFVISSFGLFFICASDRAKSFALKYVLMNIIGTMLFLIAAGLVYGQAGTLNFARLNELLVQEKALNEEAFHLVLGILLISLLVKASAFPFFMWLPKAYASLPTPVVTLFAACLTKVGVYVIYRMTVVFFPLGWPEPLRQMLFLIAALTMLLGVFAAASQWEQKKILSFHIVSQVGYMLFAAAIGTEWALAAGLLFVVHNVLAKSNLFLIAGLIERYFGSDNLKHQGGLLKHSKLLSLALFIAAFSMAGLPPFMGFFAKMMVIFGGLKEQLWLLTLIALVTAFFTLFSMSKIWLEAAMKPSPSHKADSAQNQHISFGEKSAVGLLALVSLVLGLGFAPLWTWTSQAVTTSFQFEHTAIITGVGKK